MAREETPLRRILTDFFASPGAGAATLLLVLILIAALAAPLIVPQKADDPAAQAHVQDARLPPGATASSGNTFWLGSDDQGHDLLAAILYGLRTSFTVGTLSTLIALPIGLALGLGAAYFGGRTEAVTMRLAGSQLSFPAILIALVLLAALGQGIGKLIVALAVVQWAYYARTARGAALVEKGKEYIEAARGLALRPWRIVWGHLLPNCLPALLVVAAGQVAVAIALEATLSFLGLGLPTTEPSLGLLIASGYRDLPSGSYWISFFPGVALSLTILSINLVAEQLGGVLQPPRQR